jgi:hypothetical protein
VFIFYFLTITCDENGLGLGENVLGLDANDDHNHHHNQQQTTKLPTTST